MSTMSSLRLAAWYSFDTSESLLPPGASFWLATWARRHQQPPYWLCCHYNDVIMGAIASQITCLPIVYSKVYSGADQRKHQSSASYISNSHRAKCLFVRLFVLYRRYIIPYPVPTTSKWVHFLIKVFINTFWATLHLHLTHWDRDKWTPLRRRHFQIDFLEWKCLNSD